jgi:UDPglucose 6-dehydrogenase
VRALIKTGNEYSQDLKILQAVESVNENQKYRLIDKITRHYGDDLTGKIFAIWGLSFKPNTDDMREAPSRVIIQELVKRGAKIQAYDPIAMKAAWYCFKLDFESNPKGLGQITLGDSVNVVLENANALLIVTEWKAFRSPDLKMIKQHLLDSVIFDGRNLYEPVDAAAVGLLYYGIGRST